MKIHYLNCGTMHPRLAPFFAPHLSRVPALCLLIETPRSLVLVDSGFGTRDMEDLSRLGLANLLINAQADPLRPAVRQLEGLGFRPSDVTDIICTHLDRDHAGGLPDFPDARVHVMRAERDAAASPRNFRERERYRKCHFEHGPKWVTHEGPRGDRWYGLECIRELPGLPPEIIMVPLRGHTRGHSGVAVDTGKGWVLHCGDAYYVKREFVKAPIDVRNFRRMADLDNATAVSVVGQIRDAVQTSGGAVTTIAAHDRSEYQRLFGRDLD